MEATATVETCRVCGLPISITVDENGWPTIEDVQAFVEEHQKCLALTVRRDEDLEQPRRASR